MCGTHFRRRREASPHTLNCMAYARRWSIFFKPVLLFYFSQAANVVLGGSSALVGGASNEASTTTPLANNGRARFVYFHLFFFIRMLMEDSAVKMAKQVVQGMPSTT